MGHPYTNAGRSAKRTGELISMTLPETHISDTTESPRAVDASHFRRISSSFGLMGSDELGRFTRSEVIIHG